VAQIIVRGLDDAVKRKLKRRAERAGHSMEAEIRQILRAAAAAPTVSQSGLGSRIASRFRAAGLDDDIEELRGHRATPPDFER